MALFKLSRIDGLRLATIAGAVALATWVLFGIDLAAKPRHGQIVVRNKLGHPVCIAIGQQTAIDPNSNRPGRPAPVFEVIRSYGWQCVEGGQEAIVAWQVQPQLVVSMLVAQRGAGITKTWKIGTPGRNLCIDSARNFEFEIRYPFHGDLAASPWARMCAGETVSFDVVQLPEPGQTSTIVIE